MYVYTGNVYYIAPLDFSYGSRAVQLFTRVLWKITGQAPGTLLYPMVYIMCHNKYSYIYMSCIHYILGIIQHTHTHTHTYAYTHTHTHICVYMLTHRFINM